MKQVHLWEAPFSGVDRVLLRKAAGALAKYACDGPIVGQRVAGDPVYDEITCSHPLSKAAVRFLSWMASHLGAQEFSNELLIHDDPLSIVYQAGPAWCSVGTLEVPRMGDFLLLDVPFHHCIVSSYEGTKMNSWDYGQYHDAKQLPCGRPMERAVTRPFTLGDSKIVGWVNIERLHFDTCATVPDSFVLGTQAQ
jgi:hypothetical protein